MAKKVKASSSKPPQKSASRASLRDVSKPVVPTIVEEVVDSTSHVQVDSLSTSETASAIQSTPQGVHHMVTLTLDKLNKRGNRAIYKGAAQRVQLSLALFENKTAPQTISVDGPFVAAKTPRAKLTPEERKALPKPTLAERVQRAKDRAAKLQAKLDAEASNASHASM